MMLHCQHKNDFCIKMGSDERHLNFSLIARDKVIRQTATFLKKKDSRRQGKDPRSFCLPAYRLTARPKRFSACASNSAFL